MSNGPLDEFGAFLSEPESPQQGCAGCVFVIIMLGLIAVAWSYAIEQNCGNSNMGGCLLLVLPNLYKL